MIIDVQGLEKSFGAVQAVAGISFSFSSGRITGFVGPNGAGKTTTMRILATLDEPNDGDVLLDGESIVQTPELARRHIGFVPDALPAHSDIRVLDYLDFFARAYGLQGGKRRQILQEIEEFTGLGEIRLKLIRDLSKGIKQRLSLARALIHDPAALVLDEPAAGLDPRARIELRELLTALAERNKAILISSHILTELSEICDDTVIIERGKLLHAGPVHEVLDLETLSRVAIRSLEPAADLQRALLETPGVESVRLASKGGLEAEVQGGAEECAQLLADLVGRGFRIVEFRRRSNDLEQVFMRITQGEVQ